MVRDPIGCYVHIPFCVRKCAYCDFNSYSGYSDSLVRRYVAAIELEILTEGTRGEDPPPIDTVFFGGGTPTAIPAKDEVRLLDAVTRSFTIAPDPEITTEANPGASDTTGLCTLRAGGFNRISFGVQSFDDGLLRVLDRIHSASEAKNAVRSARDAGFDNVSVDLMFGLPTQSMEQWRDTLRQAVDMGTDHISLYSLIVEDGTGFATMARKGMLALPSDDLAADMYQTAIDEAAAAGFVQYEISNFAKPGFESRHNLHYWRNDEYYGFGAGAVAFRNGARRTNLPRPLAYAKAVEERESLLSDEDRPDRAGQISETMFLGLRLTREGVDCRRFQKRFGEDPRNMFPDIIEKYRKLGLLESDDDGVRLTPRGVFLGNDVMSEFI